MDNTSQITVTSPLLPDLEEYNALLQDIWNRKWITNNGYYHRQLEQALADYLGVEYVSLFTNGTLPLITALQALRIQGEVITTPYSFVATTHAIWWNGLTPVFVDIDPRTGNIDPDKIEAAITPRTTAIMPVHVYGKPCDVERIDAIAKKYNLRVIYDAAHAFGVKIASPKFSHEGKESFVNKWGAHTADPVLYGKLKEHAEYHRKHPTEAESVLWNILKANGLELHFRRQHIIQDFIVDFFCVDKGLSIELDGGYHFTQEQQEEDARRTYKLQQLGVTELRFTNEELLHNPDQVVSKIKETAAKLPSLQGGVGGRLVSVLQYGDMSTLSFHATKVYNTIEGGALICRSKEMKEHIDNLKNFGFRGETTVVAPGINSKMDEMRAAYGLLNLKQVDAAIEARRQVAIRYRETLRGVEGISFFEDMPGVRHNYSYFPIFVDEEKYGMSRDALYEKMKSQNVLGRRYFYPLISTFSPYDKYASATPANLPNAHKLADSVICLPMHHALSKDDVERVIACVVGFNDCASWH